MAAGLHALQHEPVRAGRFRLPRLVDVGHRHPHLAAGLLKPLDGSRGRATERERHHRDAVVLEELELGVPLVVLEARLAELDSVTLGLRAQPLDVALVARGVGCPGSGDEDVHSEGPPGGVTDLGDALAHRVCLLVAGSEEPERTRLAHRGGELGRRGTAGERGLHYGDAKLVENHYRPLKAAARFSTNAVTPSAKSSVRASWCCSSASRSSCASMFG